MISFRHYQFAEAHDQLVITKKPKTTESFSQRVQSDALHDPAGALHGVSASKESRIKRFSSGVSRTRSTENLSHLAGNTKKRSCSVKMANPLATLQAKVMKRCEQLFKEKGEDLSSWDVAISKKGGD